MKQCYILGTETLSKVQIHNFRTAVLQLYNDGVRDFYLTTASEFDLQATELMRQLKHTQKDIRLFLVVPYHKTNFQIIPPYDFDDIYFPTLDGISPDRFWEHTQNTMMRDSQYTIVHMDNNIIINKNYKMSEQEIPGTIFQG